MTRRILITGARAPAALHLARLMAGAGHHVVMADSLRWPLGAASNMVAGYVRLPAANGGADDYAAAVHKALLDHQIDLVVPTCEEVFHLARMWTQGDLPAPLFAPAFDLLAKAHNKHDFVQMARALGLQVPQTRLLTSDDDLAACADQSEQLVFKPAWSRFATRVLVRPRRLTCTPSETDPWLAQEYIAGEEVCAYAVANAGKLAAVAAYRPLYRAGHGAGVAFLRDDGADVTQYLRQFVEGTKWHGQVSLDLIRRSDGTLFAIECNPRATSGIHFFRSGPGFARALCDGESLAPDIREVLAIKAALAVYGPLRRPLGLWMDMRQMRDVVAWPGDPAPAWRQFASICEFAMIALRRRVSLTAATTHDIAWDGD